MATKMDDFTQKYVQPVKSWWASLTPKRKKQLMILGPVLLLTLIALVVWLNYKPYAVLYQNLDLAEAGQIVNSLEEKGVSVRTKNDSTVLVPENQVAELKMQLAMEGYPKNGLSYDFYIDNVDTMSTDSDRKTYKIYQLNKLLQESIKTINGVKDAIVLISIPENNGYVLKTDNSTATASVVVTMAGSEPLTNAQVNGIKQLVSKSVVGMPTDGVAVIDGNTGEEVGGDSNSLTGKASDRLAIEKEIDKTIEDKVKRQLQLLIGDSGNIQVVATSRINTDDMLTQSKQYTPMNEDSTTGVTSQENHLLESDDNGILAAGVPGAESNADVPNYPAMNGELDGNTYTNQYQYDYKVNETLQEIQKGDIVLESLKVSVVIQSEVLDDSELDNMIDLVATTANVETDDVYIYIQNTNAESEEGQTVSAMAMLQQNWWIVLIVVVVLLLLVILVVILLRRKRQKEEAEAEAEALAAQEEARRAAEAAKSLAGADSQPKLTEEEAKQQQVLEQVRGFAKEHPDVAAQIIRGWLKGDE